MRFPKRLFHLSCTALLLTTFLTPAAAARRFSMSYVYFGSPSSYVARVDGTQGSLDEISPNYFNLNSDGTLNFTGGAPSPPSWSRCTGAGCGWSPSSATTGTGSWGERP